ncbi:MAG: PQQ-binding-like beta-propeller repeat protein, partial [Phycisphaerae bacterium]
MTIMGRYTRRGGGAWPVLSGILAATVCLPAAGQWPGWGGPTRDFKVDAGNLASRWPDEGPKRIWTRDLGDGLSSIAVDDGRLFTMYRKGREEVVVSLDAKTGDTVWEHKYGISKVKGISDEFGKGPQSTPLVHGGRVYTLGKTGRVHCLDKQTGKPFWSHDLVEAFQVKPPYFGFASSPIAYKNNLIVVAGGKGSGLMAFDLADGTLRWKKLDLKNTYSSPILINVDGEDQIVVLSNREIVGVAAVSGELRWRHPHENQWKTNICTPVWGEDN